MQLTTTVVLTALLAASTALSASVTLFAGAGCTGSQQGPVFNLPSGECGTLNSGSVKSIRYSGVPSQIQFFVSGGAHDSCTNGAQLTLGGGSGCATAPAGFNWESVAIF